MDRDQDILTGSVIGDEGVLSIEELRKRLGVAAPAKAMKPPRGMP